MKFITLILFWDCSSSNKWLSHLLANKESKHLKINSVLSSKSLWKLSRKKNTTLLLTNGRCTSKLQNTREEIFSI